ncbi:MAG: GtrA family protein [Spirochaetales bacterium]|nr:GtrA family protein [Spirochaetales bacterium]
MLKKILAGKNRFIKFAAVGLSGTIVNLSIVWLGNTLLFTSLKEPHQTWMSVALAIVISIFSNYVLNFLWTWRDRRAEGSASFFLHLIKYYLASMAAAGLQFLIAGGINYFLKINFFHQTGGIPVFLKMGASFAGICCAMILNFLLNHFWTFKDPTRGEEK